MDRGLQLQRAIADRDREAVSRLLDSGLDVNADLGGGLKALFFAVRINDREMIQFLADRGADVNARNNEGSTPLHFAACVWNEGDTTEEKLRTCQLLLERGADVALRNAAGATPLDACQAADLKEALLASHEPARLPSSAVYPSVPPAPPGSSLERARRWADEALRTQSLQAALDIIDRIPSLQGVPGDVEGLQACYVTALANLTTRARTAEEAEEVHKRLVVTPVYGTDRVHQLNHLHALMQAASQARPVRHGRDIAQLIPRLPNYASDPELQLGHAQTLFAVSQETRNGFQSQKLAQEIQRIPIYPTSEAVQFECAKTLCNATGFASSGNEARIYALAIQSLPFYLQSARIQDAHSKAVRNVERYAQDSPAAAPAVETVSAVGLGRVGKMVVALLVVVLSLGLFGGLIRAAIEAFNSPPPGAVSDRRTPKPARPGAEDFDTPRVSLKVGQQLESARVELERGHYDNAKAFANKALDLAGESKADRMDAVRLLARIHEEAGEPNKALQYYYDFPKADKLRARSDKLRLGREELDKLDYGSALAQAEMAIEVDKLVGGNGREGRELKAQVLEASGKTDQAITEYRTLAKQHPEHKEYQQKVEGLPLGVANERLAQAEKMLVEGNYTQAEAEGVKAAEQFASLPGHRKDEARARTVVAKAAYTAGRHSAAVAQMKRVVDLEPDKAEHRERLASYRARDRMSVTSDELVHIENFEFPDPVATDKRWTYFSAFTADGQEKTLAGADCPLNVSASYYNRRRVSYSISSSGSFYQGSFDAGGDAVLVPGAYTDARDYSYYSSNRGDDPELSFASYGMECEGFTGRFVIHEVVFSKDRSMERFAADFLVNCGRSRHLFGRVRYHSKYQ